MVSKKRKRKEETDNELAATLRKICKSTLILLDKKEAKENSSVDDGFSSDVSSVDVIMDDGFSFGLNSAGKVQKSPLNSAGFLTSYTSRKAASAAAKLYALRENFSIRTPTAAYRKALATLGSPYTTPSGTNVLTYVCASDVGRVLWVIKIYRGVTLK